MSNADVADVVQKISRRVIRKLRRLGYLEAGIDVPVATGYDLLLDNKPELARTMAASVKQRIAFGERAGEKVRRIGSGFDYEGEHPELKGPRCASPLPLPVVAKRYSPSTQPTSAWGHRRGACRGSVFRLFAHELGITPPQLSQTGDPAALTSGNPKSDLTPSCSACTAAIGAQHLAVRRRVRLPKRARNPGRRTGVFKGCVEGVRPLKCRLFYLSSR